MGQKDADTVQIQNRDEVDNDFKAKTVQSGLEEIDFRRETKEPTGILNRFESQISFDNATRTFTITPVGESFTYFIRGEQFDVTNTRTAQITDTEGIWFFHFDNTGTLIATQTEWDFEEPQAFVAIVYWDATNKKQIIFGEERHGLVMDWATHKRFHEVVGTEIGKEQFRPYNYVVQGDGSLDTHVQLALNGGSLYDEDIQIDIVDSPAPVNNFEQILSPIAQIPVYYKTGVNGDWRKKDATNFPLYEDAGNTPFFNNFTGGAWNLTNVTNGSYITMTICITNDLNSPVIAVLAQHEYSNIIDSVKGVDNERVELTLGLPFTEIYFKEYLVFECRTTFANTVKARLVEIVDADSFTAKYDRYQVPAIYGGNANTGRYLEMFAGIDSLEAPLIFPEDGFIRTVTIKTKSSPGVGKKIGFFETSDLVTPRFEITLENSLTQTINVSRLFLRGEQMSVRVTNGNLRKPALRIFIETFISSGKV